MALKLFCYHRIFLFFGHYTRNLMFTITIRKQRTNFLNRILYCFLFQKLNSSPSACFRLYFKHQYLVFTKHNSRGSLLVICTPFINTAARTKTSAFSYNVWSEFFKYLYTRTYIDYCKAPLSTAAKKLYHHDDDDGDDGVIRSFTRFDLTVFRRSIRRWQCTKISDIAGPKT